MRDLKIVILTAGYGNGHIQVSRTLQQSFYRRGIGNISIVDLYQEAHPGMNSISRYLYLCSPYFSSYGLDYYGWSYYATRNAKTNSAFAKWSGWLGVKKFAAILKELRPDAIICTFPFGGISETLKKNGIHVPWFTVVTDFSLHNRWLLTRSDRFYVATEDLKTEMVRRGADGDAITVTGIPVREPFCTPASRKPEQPRPRTILILMGAYIPLPNIQLVIAKLLALENVRVDIVCGGNDKMKRRLERRFAGNDRLRLFGYVEEIHERMRRASCVITKAGGITLSEAIQIRTPIVVYRPFSGQELENARYLERKGAASVASSVGELVERAREILDSEEKRNEMIRQYEALAVGHASDTIVEDVLHMVAEQPVRAGEEYRRQVVCAYGPLAEDDEPDKYGV